MVQVDVFWAYGWGASLAAAAGRTLTKRERPLESKYFVATILFLSLIWAPTGMLLLLRHPSWETMQVADNLRSMSVWLILAFGITNVTQGILGFWVGKRLLEKGQNFYAHLNWIAGYFGMFFILLYGWDGLGYDRFLYDRDMVLGSPAWSPGVATASGVLTALAHFLKSSVAMTLYIDGAYLLPPFFYLATRWIRADFLAERGEGSSPPAAGKMIRVYLGAVFLVGLGGAAVCALCVRGVATLLGVGSHIPRALGETSASTGAHVASYFIGLPVGLLLLWAIALRPGGWLNRYLRPLLAAA